MYNPQEVVCFKCHCNPCECPGPGKPPFRTTWLALDRIVLPKAYPWQMNWT
jgi:hypothetical protein